MMKLRIEEIGGGLHPSELVVAFKTDSGIETLVLDRRSVRDNSIFVGYPIRQEGETFLVELPRESQSGSWRVWVDSNQLFEEKRLRA